MATDSIEVMPLYFLLLFILSTINGKSTTLPEKKKEKNSRPLEFFSFYYF